MHFPSLNFPGLLACRNAPPARANGILPYNPNRGTCHRNLPDSSTGGSTNNWRNWNNCQRPDANKGYGIDLNRNGRFDKGQDGVLMFDMNRDGKYDKTDVSKTNDLMKAATGNFDFNGDGRIDRMERIQGRRYQQQFARMDRNRDGRLDTHEMNSAGGRVWIDHSKGGGIGKNEVHSVYNIPSPFIGGSSRTLSYVDPFSGVSQTHSNGPWWPTGNSYMGGR